jgi:anhydro-N-acetylmuramic acid kinase
VPPDSDKHPLERLLQKRKKRVIGLMSGTSLDGVDAALVEVDGWGAETRANLCAFQYFAFSDAEKAEIQALFHGDTRAVCEANFRLAERFASAARIVMDGEVDLIGSHGQTLWHQPPSAHSGTASTLQIGEPALIAARTGVVTVGDFRVADVACGGEGAPLVPWCDWVLYRRPGKLRALQNIGGIANVTAVGEQLSDVIAFDNGPGNMMIDALAPLASKGADAIDRDGMWSAQGRVQEDLLAQLLDDDYLRRAPPKSTGRERYGRQATLAWADRHRDRAPLDLLATLVAFTAHAIADSYRFIGTVDEVLVSGGGAHNRTLMTQLAALLPKVAPLGAKREVDAKEAVAFAVLAVQAVHAVPANVPRVTGASRPAVLGKICFP